MRAGCPRRGRVPAGPGDPGRARKPVTEFGCGGDEVNLLLPGRNYGWPLYSKGLDYDGTPVEYHKELGLEFDLSDIEQPVVDLTPSPAVSSFILYAGNAFPEWQDDLIVGTLKATELYRIVLDGDRLVHMETLLEDLVRIRNVETGPDGAIGQNGSGPPEPSGSILMTAKLDPGERNR